MTYVVVGASSGLGRSLAERFAEAGQSLVLVASDERDVSAVAADLALRFGVAARGVALDLADGALPYDRIDTALAGLPPLEGLLLAAGAVAGDDMPGETDEALRCTTYVNYLSVCRLVNHFLPRLAEGRGLIVGFGSVAATRGRTRNAAYSAAKRALESYFESLRHAIGGRALVQFYVLGYLDTNLSFGARTPLPPVSPRRCAEQVFRARERDFGRRYYPRYWAALCFLLSRIPWFVFRRMSF